MSNNSSKLILKQGKEKSLKRLHPWVFSGAIQKIIGNPVEGDVVELYDSENNFLAKGHYQPDSITLRILTFKNEEINSDFWYNKLLNVVNARKYIGLYDSQSTNVLRLVHGEGDFLPGLIIDLYNNIAVIQCHSAGMYKSRFEIAEQLKKITGSRIEAIYDKSYNTLPFKFTEKKENSFLIGNCNNETEVTENNHKFIVNIAEGQKTGFFIDQRENRNLLAKYSKNKNIANLFSYTGGFSVYALCAGATSVVSVDSSAKANELAARNIMANNVHDNHEIVTDDVLNFINNIEQKYDIIVLDPPAFAKHNKNLNNALQAYKKINFKAINAVKKNGLIFTFSCSQAVSKSDFKQAVFAAAATTQRNVRIIHQLSQPPDHPISIYHPEGEYLKGLVLFVE